MPRFLPALKFAFWTYVWSLALCLLFYLVTEFSNRGDIGPGMVWYSASYYWGILKSFWPLPLPLFPAALLASLLAPQWWKGLTLLLMLALVVLLHFPAALTSVMFWVFPAALLASVPGLIRSRRPRLSSRHD